MSSPISQRKNPRKMCSGQNIKVFVRCRPMNGQEKAGRSHSLVECHAGRDIIVRERPHDKFTKTFSFDKVFAPDSKQLDVYKCVAKPLVDEVLNGFNCTIFAYGQTGTGKTFTMEGERTSDSTSWQEDPLAGIIPRCVNHLFDELRIQKLEFTMRVSFLELYNEELFDLLSAQDDLSKLRLYEDSSRKGSCIIQGLEEVLVRSKTDVYHVIEKGSAKRQTAATLMNAHSSRSHTVFTVTIHIKENTIDGDELLKTGKLHLVDLAGSENIGRSGAVDKRAREAGSINQSLLTLGRVITSLVEKAPHVPYRESKLTRLLQDALGGRTKTSIIATVSPASINLEETLSTLDYAHRAKNITNKPEVNQKLNKKELIGEYTEEIERLRLDLLAMREKNGVYLANENYQEMVDTMEQQAKEIADKIAHIRTIEEQLDRKKELFEEISVKLSKTTERLDETVSRLKSKQQLLRNKETLLTATAQDRDEQKHLVGVHVKTEGALASHGKSLITVAETTTSHVEKLQEKIDRKRNVEEHNSEKAASFEATFSNHMTSMHTTLSQFKDSHSSYLSTLAAEHGAEVSSLCSALSSSASQVSSVKEAVTGLLATLQDRLHEASSCSVSLSQQQSEGTASSSSTEAARLTQYRTEVLQPLVDSITQLADSHNSLANTVTTALTCKVREWEQSSAARHAEHAAHCDSLLERLQQQMQLQTEHTEQQLQHIDAINDAKHKHAQDMRHRMQRMFTELSSLESSCASHEATTDQLVEEIKTRQTAALQRMTANDQQTIAGLEGERESSGSHLSSVNDRATAITGDLDNLREKLVSSVTELTRQSDGVNSSVQHCLTESSGVLSSLADTHTALHQQLLNNTASHHAKVAATAQAGEEEICSLVTRECDAVCSNTEQLQLQSVQLQDRLKLLVTEHSDTLAEHGLQLQDRQTDLQELFSHKMVKDVPTGSTPARQEYAFSRSLPSTSPHGRILQRLRAGSNTRAAALVPLPPDNELSFSTLDNSAASDQSSHCSPVDDTRPRATSMSDIREPEDNVFVVPLVPGGVVRHNSREDGSGLTSGIPAPIRPTNSAPVSRSSSVSSLTDTKENLIMNNNGSSRKMHDVKTSTQHSGSFSDFRPRKVLGTQN